MILNLIVCTSPDLGIGSNNNLLGNVKEDMRFFTGKTSYKAILMGSNTARSMPRGKPLANRLNYVLCREHEREGFIHDGFIPLVFDNPLDCLSYIKHDELFIIGGGFIYSTFIGLSDIIYKNTYYNYPEHKADVYFPDISTDQWRIVESRVGDDENLIFEKYVRL